VEPIGIVVRAANENDWYIRRRRFVSRGPHKGDYDDNDDDRDDDERDDGIETRGFDYYCRARGSIWTGKDGDAETRDV